MDRLRTTVMWAIAAIALGAVAVWPFYVRHSADAARAASLPAAVAVTTEADDRDKTIAFWERAQAEHHRGDMISPNALSGLYMQRYRERGDIDDVVRSVHAAQQSLRAQPYGNTAALVSLGSALVALHRFKDALAVTQAVERVQPGDPAMEVREASVDLELGRYAPAKTIIASLQRTSGSAGTRAALIPLETLETRYDELTGHLARARARFAKATAYEDAQPGGEPEQRAWFWFRSGELAFEAGDNGGAVADEHRSLATFANFSEANRALARVECAMHAWQACLAAATASAQVVPYPEVLGYEVDAQRALGHRSEAAQTDALIRTIERIGNAQRVSDRLLAIYYCEHGEKLEDAYRIARRELAVRDDVFTEDTLAWCAATTGRWSEARTRSAAALRYGTQNALLDYHAGIIALHFGRRDEARRRLGAALALDPQFHPAYADDARARLAALR